MTGSEKQIAWATDIQRRTLAAFDAMFAAMPADHEAAPLVTELRAALVAESNSRFWIDQHGLAPRHAIKAIALRNERTARLAQ